MTGADLPVVAVVGPTGTGKTALGVEIALRLGGEVVNADSMQFYRGMDIGTAKATTEERRGVPHHLLDVLDVTEEASVADFQRAARTCFAQIRSRGRVPVLVGGSGLYVRAALDVLELPGTDPAVRARIEGELAERGPGALRERLRQVDPESAARLQDERRLVRALEVWDLTGRPFTSFMPRREHVEPTVQIGLDVERPALHDRLARRVGAMVEAGLEAEVRTLAARGLREGRTASRALGYGQFLDVVDGRSTVEQAVEATVVATRRFARRQLTWFRGDPRVHWLDPAAPGVVERAVRLVEDSSSGPPQDGGEAVG